MIGNSTNGPKVRGRVTQTCPLSSHTATQHCIETSLWSKRHKRRPVGSPYPADSFSSNIWAMNKLRTDIES
eukprot:scaffold349_cov157-Skeletonema_dohrnii-CCMP3373.AAC.1